jgi:hypothetical protein
VFDGKLSHIPRHHHPIKWYKVESKAINVKELYYGAQLYFSEYCPPGSKYQSY